MHTLALIVFFAGVAVLAWLAVWCVKDMLGYNFNGWRGWLAAVGIIASLAAFCLSIVYLDDYEKEMRLRRQSPPQPAQLSPLPPRLHEGVAAPQPPLYAEDTNSATNTAR